MLSASSSSHLQILDDFRKIKGLICTLIVLSITLTFRCYERNEKIRFVRSKTVSFGNDLILCIRQLHGDLPVTTSYRFSKIERVFFILDIFFCFFRAVIGLIIGLKRLDILP